MPLLGNYIGISLFDYTSIKPRIILFLIFLFLSIDMFIHFFETTTKKRNLNLLGMLFFAFSVSFDSFSVGLGISYLYSNILLCVSTFCLVSTSFTILGFILGRTLSEKLGKYAFLIGSIILLIYSVIILTK